MNFLKSWKGQLSICAAALVMVGAVQAANNVGFVITDINYVSYDENGENDGNYDGDLTLSGRINIKNGKLRVTGKGNTINESGATLKAKNNAFLEAGLEGQIEGLDGVDQCFILKSNATVTKNGKVSGNASGNVTFD